MQRPRPRVRNSLFLLGFLIIGLIGVVGLALVRTKGDAQDPGRLGALHSAHPKRLPPKGPWKLLKITPFSVTETDIQGVGHVKETPGGLETKSGIVVWAGLPQNAIAPAVQATAQFGSLRPLAVFPVETTSSGVVAIAIPQNYPPGNDSCLLRLQQGSIDFSALKIEGLKPTKRAWPPTLLAEGPVTCGPATISARVWISSNMRRKWIEGEFSVAISGHEREHWYLDPSSLTATAFVPSNTNARGTARRPGPFYDINAGAFVDSLLGSIPLAELQGEALLEGRLTRYEVADEFVDFHNVPLKQDPLSKIGERHCLFVAPDRPIAGRAASGVEVTLLPISEKSLEKFGHDAMQGVSPLFIFYRTNPKEKAPFMLPRSPAAKGLRMPVSITVFPEHEATKEFVRPQGSSMREEAKAKNFSYCVTDGKGYQEGVCPTLRLRIRHRADLQSYPYRFAVHILPAPPSDLKELMPEHLFW